MSAAGGGKKKPANVFAQKPNHAVVWVATGYPSWQATVMTHLSSEYKDGKEPENKSLAAAFSKMPELKKYQKKLMPFVQMIKERVRTLGVEYGLKQTSEFDEIEVLEKNRSYFMNSLEVYT